MPLPQPLGTFLPTSLLTRKTSSLLMVEWYPHSQLYMVETRQKMPDEFSRLQCVVSLGTGRIDSSHLCAKDEEAPDVFVTSMIKKFLFPWKIPDAIGNVKHLFNLFVSRATESDGLPAQTAQEWCNSIGYRYHWLSPPLQNAISLDLTERSNIIDMLYATALYVLEK